MGRIAYLIGSSRFDPSSGLQDLIGPPADVQGLATILADSERGGFAVSTFLNEPAHQIVKKLYSDLRKRDREDTILFYFSGHGLLDEENRLWLACSDTDASVVSGTAIRAADVIAEMRRSGARQRAIILDCCYSGAIGTEFQGYKDQVSQRGTNQFKHIAQSSGTTILTSSTDIQLAKDGAPSPFTGFLIDAIKSGDADREFTGVITLNNLFEHAKNNWETTAQPQFFDLGGAGALVVSKSGRAKLTETRRAVRQLLAPYHQREDIGDATYSFLMNRFEKESSLDDSVKAKIDALCERYIKQVIFFGTFHEELGQLKADYEDKRVAQDKGSAPASVVGPKSEMQTSNNELLGSVKDRELLSINSSASASQIVVLGIAAATVGRRLLLSSLVILPVLIGVLLSLKLYAGAIDWLSWANRDVCTLWLANPRLSDAIGVVGIVLLLVSLSVRSNSIPSRGKAAFTQREFLRFDLLTTALAALFLVLAVATPCLHNAMADNGMRFFDWSGHGIIWYGLLGGMTLYLVSYFAGIPKSKGFGEFRRSLIGWISAGAVFGFLMAVGVISAHKVFTAPVEKWGVSAIVLLICGVPWVMASQLVAEIVLVGHTRVLENSDDDREWLGRMVGWILVVSVGWIVLMVLMFIGSGWADGLYPRLQSWLVPICFLSGVAAAVLGRINLTPAASEHGSFQRTCMNVALIGSAIVFSISLIIVTSGVIDLVLFGKSFVEVLQGNAQPPATGYATISSEFYSIAEALLLVIATGWFAFRYANIDSSLSTLIWKRRTSR